MTKRLKELKVEIARLKKMFAEEMHKAELRQGALVSCRAISAPGDRGSTPLMRILLQRG